MFKRFKLLGIGLIIGLSVFTFSSSSSAYSLLGYHVPAGYVYYEWGDGTKSSGTIIRNAYEAALLNWNSAQPYVSFYNSPKAVNFLNSYYVSSSSEYGYTDSVSSGSNIKYFNMYINAGNSNIFSSNVARSVAAHELGHTLGLKDLSSGTALMNQNRNRASIYTPQSDDLNGVNASYR